MDTMWHLARHIFTDKSTLSDLYLAPGVFECNILEDTVRRRDVNGNQTLEHFEKVVGETAIPANVYEIKMEWSPRYQRNMPFLYGKQVGRGDPKNLFNDCMIHWGNKPEHSKGCLLTGVRDKNTPDWVSSSQKAFNDLEPKIRAALAKGRLFLNIQGGYSV